MVLRHSCSPQRLSGASVNFIRHYWYFRNLVGLWFRLRQSFKKPVLSLRGFNQTKPKPISWIRKGHNICSGKSHDRELNPHSATDNTITMALVKMDRSAMTRHDSYNTVVSPKHCNTVVSTLFYLIYHCEKNCAFPIHARKTFYIVAASAAKT